ncbi:MAG: hypothetical protein E5X80_26110 [Mesorhizobium sp.]|nr:MAG: hypothetical protein E5X78_27895 [Mesorhizobium sp.]TIO62068.1 MAG: hypothetical protein E5X79_05190 [Mesorhizobium sp.]TJV59169.1 MAG: hypothetical protein E5X80_26110 [Mesorhizobium sp.]
MPALFNSPGDPDLKAAVDFILERPPRKQIIANGVLTWSDSVPDTDLLSDRLLIYVRRVRNNLFHGGKFNGHWFEPERSELLLRHSLVILRACINASNDLGEAFHN